MDRSPLTDASKASNSSANCWAYRASTYYYQPRPESAENLRLLRAPSDEWYLKVPFFGSRKMAVQLGVGRHRACWRLMRIPGHRSPLSETELEPAGAGSPGIPIPAARRGDRGGPTTSGAPILLTFRCAAGFLYLVAVMDWFSRFVLSWLNSPIRWKPVSAWRRWTLRFACFGQPGKSGTPIRAQQFTSASTSWRRSSSAEILDQHGWCRGRAHGQCFHRTASYGARSSTS